METCQEKRIVGEKNLKMQHIPNFIGVTVICTNCIREKKWEKPLKEKENECFICGQDRTLAFCNFDFTEAKVSKKFIVKNPLNKFIKWLLNNFNRHYNSIILAHNGVSFI
jgi:hypothetical protein